MMGPVIAFLALAFPSGVQVKVLKPGTGPGATQGDVLTMLYKGTLKNGTVFDQNLAKPPFAFRLGAKEVIEGWEQGLKRATVGSKLKLVVPPQLGYGSQASGPIPANSTLTFEVEVLRIDRPTDRPVVKIVELKQGTGAEAKRKSKVSVNYRGTFLNGVLFDESRGRPLSFELGAGMVVPGFEDAVRGMKVGGKRKATIPYRLAYGESGRPPLIPRMATLVFELELLESK